MSLSGITVAARRARWVQALALGVVTGLAGASLLATEARAQVQGVNLNPGPGVLNCFSANGKFHIEANGNCNGFQEAEGDTLPTGLSAGTLESNTLTVHQDATISGGLNMNNSSISGVKDLTGNGTGVISGFKEANFVDLSAINGSVTNLTATNGNISSLTAATGNITDLTATNGTVTNLTATNGNIASLTAATGNITDLTATNGTITNLTATNGNIASLTAGTATVTDLTVTGTTSTTGINNTGDITNTGKISTNTLETTGNVTVGGSLAVAKGATVSESFTVTPGSDINMGGNVVHGVAAPIVGTDAANKQYVDDGLSKAFKEIDRNTQGIAIAMAMSGLSLPDGKNFALGANMGFFDDKQAIAIQAAIRISPNVMVTGGFGTGVQDMGTTGGRIGVQAAW